MDDITNKLKRILVGYYGLLQLVHLVVLTAAGLLYLKSKDMPFPAQPPPGGWEGQVLPFLLGMGTVDAVAAFLGVWFAGIYLVFGTWKWIIGMISITIGLTSAGIFAAGTGANGAWIEHPLTYGGMVIAFSPMFILYYYLLQGES